jgi:hypothetical protein
MGSSITRRRWAMMGNKTLVDDQAVSRHQNVRASDHAKEETGARIALCTPRVPHAAYRGLAERTTTRESSREVRPKRPREPWYVGLVIALLLISAISGIVTVYTRFDGSAGVTYSDSWGELSQFPLAFLDWFGLIGLTVAPLFLLVYYVRGVWFPVFCLIVCGLGALMAYDALTPSAGEDIGGIGALAIALMLILCLVAAVSVMLGAIIGNGVSLIVRRRRRTN